MNIGGGTLLYTGGGGGRVQDPSSGQDDKAGLDLSNACPQTTLPIHRQIFQKIVRLDTEQTVIFRGKFIKNCKVSLFFIHFWETFGGGWPNSVRISTCVLTTILLPPP